MKLTYSKIRQVKTVRSDSKANKLLLEGWKLLDCGMTRSFSKETPGKPFFILGAKPSTIKED